MNSTALANIEEMLALWPAPCGLYVASGFDDMVPAMEHLIVRYRAALGSIYWVDSGNRFNAYQMADTAKRFGLDAGSLLRSIKIARPFTAFQFQQMLDKIPTTDVPPLVVISDLLALFFDPELQEADLQRAFREFLTKLMRLKRRAVVMSLLLPHRAPPGREHLTERVLTLADRLHESAVPRLA